MKFDEAYANHSAGVIMVLLCLVCGHEWESLYSQEELRNLWPALGFCSRCRTQNDVVSEPKVWD